MAPSLLQQRRTHNSLLFQKLLNLRDGASPFTLVLDNLEQGSGPVVREFARRAKISKSKIIFFSFSTLRKKVPFDIDIFVSARGKSLANLRTELLSHLPSPLIAAPAPSANAAKFILIIDTLNHLASTDAHHLSTFLSSLISPQISLLATYHTDIPLPAPSSPYSPDPLTTLTYLATAILTLYSLPQTLARKRARDKSLQEPVFGLREGREGIILGFTGKGKDGDAEMGVVVNMEIRRRSGRSVVENFVFSAAAASSKPTTATQVPKIPMIGEFILLDDHPLYSSVPSGEAAVASGDEDVETTFNLGLTEKQKRDRENVVLPYFDAQKEGGAAGPGEGGRILYDMGEEDREDFDDEEDEI